MIRLEAHLGWRESSQNTGEFDFEVEVYNKKKESLRNIADCSFDVEIRIRNDLQALLSFIYRPDEAHAAAASSRSRA